MDLLAQMVTFVRVVETGSLSAAARAQKLSLPAVSRQLRALEEDLDASLISRSTRRLAVTDAGQRWYEHCVRILNELDNARGAVGESVRGTLVVSAAVTLGINRVVPRLAALIQRHPGLSIDLRLEDRLIDFAADAVDVAVRGGVPPPDTAAVIARPLMSFRRVVVASNGYLRRRGTPKEPDQLARHDCLIQSRSSGACDTWRLVRGTDVRSVNVRGALRTNAPLVMRSLACQGAGLAFLPEWLVDKDLADKRLRRVLADWNS